MDKKEAFKLFAAKNKHFVSLVNEGKTTWQKLYETYDIYGENSDVWNNLVRKETKTKGEGVKNILENIKKIDMDKLEENVTSLEKAFGFLSEILVSRETSKEEKKKNPKDNKIERFFDD